MITDLSRIRNIGVAAHIDAGKTTTTERMLFYTGRTHRVGEVDDGTTVTDFDQEEQQRGITIFSAAVTMPWKDHSINLIDTPGHVDFTAEVERSLRVLDGAVVVFDAKEGVEAQSETVWRQAAKYKVPRICFINKLDKVGADFNAAIESIRTRLSGNPIPVQIPIGEEQKLEGVIDLLTMKALYHVKAGDITNIETREIPDDLREAAETWHHHLVEHVSETNDALMDRYLHEQAISEDELRAALRAACIANVAQPVFCGSSLKHVGVRKLLDGVIDYLPSPLEVPPVVGKLGLEDPTEVIRRPDPEEPFAGLVFKVVPDRPVDLHYVRIYSGRLKSGTRIFNTVRRKKENISRLVRMFAKRREQIDEALAGDIVAVVGLKDSLTGDTICDMKHPVVLPDIQFAQTVVSLAIEPASSADRDKLSEALAALTRQDPTFNYRGDAETGQTIISGMGELHLEVITHRLTRDMGVEVRVGRPRVSYRETITTTAEAEGRFARQTGGRGQFAVVKLRVEPFAPQPGEKPIQFASEIHGGAVSKPYINATQTGVQDAALSGVLAGYPMLNVRATLLDGQEHEVDSSELAFESAGRIAFEAAVNRAGPALMEPIMKLEIVTPDAYFGAVNSDLNARRAMITGTEMRGDVRLIHAEAPLAELFGYTNSLRSLSQGRASASMEVSHYAVVPPRVADNLLTPSY